MECQVDKKEYFRHLLFAFIRGAKATNAVREICEVYGEEATSLKTAPNWFKRFKDGSFDLKDTHRTERPVQFDEERLNQLTNEDPHQTMRQLAAIMECSHSTIERHLHLMGNVQ